MFTVNTEKVMSINQHIEDNLKYYLSLDKPEYAFLIVGSWGSGKTHFINHFINKHNKNNTKFIKISVFGLNNTIQIDQGIFQELHPILGSKYVKFAGNLIKGAISLGFKLDMDSNGKEDININGKVDKLALSDFINPKKNNKYEIIIILDDIERSDIPLKELLGFVNHLVEISEIKVILIANEEIILNSESTETYNAFKEKVIGKTFEVHNDVDGYIEQLLKVRTKLKTNKHSVTIKDIYIRSQYSNLRIIKQSLDDFEFILKHIKAEYLKDEIFFTSILYEFLALSFEIKHGNLSQDELKNNVAFKSNGDNNNVEKNIYKKYFIDKSPNLNGKSWANLIFNSDFSKINDEISKLAYFYKSNEENKPLWLKLWNYRELEDDEFERLVGELEVLFKRMEYKDLRIFLHELALLIHFNKNNLCQMKLEEIDSITKEYISKHKDCESWKNSLVSPDNRFNLTGYSYYNYDDKDFIRLQNLVYESNKETFEKNKIKIKNNITKQLLDAISNNNIELITKFLIDQYSYKPIFNIIDPKEFIAVLASAKNSTITDLIDIINRRFSENTTLDSKPIYWYLREEKDFWSQTKNHFKPNQAKLKRHLLSTFFDSTVTKILRLLSE